MRSPYPEFVLTNIICIEKALNSVRINRVRTNCVRTNESILLSFMKICLNMNSNR